MSRPALIAASAGIICVVLWCIEAAAGERVMPSYLAAWLFCLALPAGALPLVMAGELAAWNTPLLAALRRLLLLMFPAAIAALPILLTLPKLYPWAHEATGGWFGIVPFCVRMVVALLLWCGLAAVLLRAPARPRRAFCRVGLMIHAVLITLFATDAVLSLNGHMSAAGIGVLVMAAQCGVALSAALLMVPARGAGALLLVALSAWAFVHFIHFLVIWSADKPDEILFYLQRENPLGEAAVWLGTATFLPAILLAWRRASPAFLLIGAPAMALLTHAIEALWLVTPASRGSFTLSLPDLSAFAGLALLSAAVLLSRGAVPRGMSS